MFMLWVSARSFNEIKFSRVGIIIQMTLDLIYFFHLFIFK